MHRFADNRHICMFCGTRRDPNARYFFDEAFTSVHRGDEHFGWHPGCWPPQAENLNDIVARHTPEGVRGRWRGEVR